MFKVFMRSFISLIVRLYKYTNGKFGGRVQGLPVLLLTTTGRKTGKKRVIPLGYFKYDGVYVITASFASLGARPGWLYNLESNPRVVLQIQNKHLTAVAETASPTLRQNLWNKLIELAPDYRAYQQRTTREILMVLLRPVEEASN